MAAIRAKGLLAQHPPPLQQHNTEGQKDRGSWELQGATQRSRGQATWKKEAMKQKAGMERVCAGPQTGSTKSWKNVTKRLAENQQSRKQHQAEVMQVRKKRERNMSQASKEAAQISSQNWKQTWRMDVKT